MKMKNFNGYKVEYADNQFPTYCATYEQAMSAAKRFAAATKVTAKVYGICEDGNRHLYTAFGKAPRT